jgi:spore coat-associated protein N
MNSMSPGRLALGVGVLAVAVVSATGLASSALFTSQDTSTGNSFAAGTVVLASGNGAAAFTVSNTQLAPRTVKYGTVQIDNSGSLQYRYAMSSASTQTKALGDHLQLKIVPIATGATCDEAAVRGGTSLYSGSLSGAAFGSKLAGADTGDRTLDAGTSEVLCMQMSFGDGSAAVDNAFQGGSDSTTLTFDAEQTLNN